MTGAGLPGLPTLVTGAGGFLGGHIARRLAACGEPVRALDLAWPAALPRGVEAITADITDEAAVDAAVADTAAVIHCVGLADLWQTDPLRYGRVNVLGTAHVLAAARRHGARVVHVSSYTTLIGKDAKGDLDETVEVPPAEMLGPYPESKRQAELAVQAAARAGQWATMVLPSAPVGAGDHRMTPPTRMILDLAAKRTPALLDCLLNLVDAQAVADGAIAARDRGRSGERYLLTGEDMPMRALAQMVAELGGAPAPRATVPLWVALTAARVEGAVSSLTGRPPKAPLTGVRLAARRVRFSAEKARRELGFAPRPVRDALAEALDWLKAQGHIPAA